MSPLCLFYFFGIIIRNFKYSKSRKFDPANCLISLAVRGPRAKIITSFPCSLKNHYSIKIALVFHQLESHFNIYVSFAPLSPVPLLVKFDGL